jgi:hypothetical protein
MDCPMSLGFSQSSDHSRRDAADDMNRPSNAFPWGRANATSLSGQVFALRAAAMCSIVRAAGRATINVQRGTPPATRLQLAKHPVCVCEMTAVAGVE